MSQNFSCKSPSESEFSIWVASSHGPAHWLSLVVIKSRERRQIWNADGVPTALPFINIINHNQYHPQREGWMMEEKNTVSETVQKVVVLQNLNNYCNLWKMLWLNMCIFKCRILLWWFTEKKNCIIPLKLYTELCIHLICTCTVDMLCPINIFLSTAVIFPLCCARCCTH